MSLTRRRLVALAVLPFVILLIAVVLTQRVEPDRSLDRVRQAGVLVVGLDPSYFPFEVVDERGGMAGFDVELIQAIALQIGVTSSLVSIDFGGIFDALDVGKFDAIVGGITPAAGQARTFGFTRSYYDAGLVALLGPASAANRLGYETGSDADVNLTILRQELRGYELTPFDDQERMRAALEDATLRGVVVDSVTASAWASRLPGLTVQSRRLTSNPFSVATRTRDRALRTELDSALARLEVSGALADLKRRWLLE